MIEKGLLYTVEHEWIKVNGNVATIGISYFAQEQLGDIVFVELPEVGDSVGKGDAFGSVESTKTVSELYSPVSGTVIKINEELLDSPEFVNESPYDKAWMIEVELSNLADLEDLLSAEQYEDETKE